MRRHSNGRTVERSHEAAQAQKKHEVEKQSVGGGRHDVPAYIRVRQLIPQGPATRPGPFFLTPGTDSARAPARAHLTPPEAAACLGELAAAVAGRAGRR